MKTIDTAKLVLVTNLMRELLKHSNVNGRDFVKRYDVAIAYSEVCTRGYRHWVTPENADLLRKRFHASKAVIVPPTAVVEPEPTPVAETRVVEVTPSDLLVKVQKLQATNDVLIETIDRIEAQQLAFAQSVGKLLAAADAKVTRLLVQLGEPA